MADHLARNYGDGLLYHRTRKGGEEIDFLVSEHEGIRCLEVKFRDSVRRDDRKWLAKYGGGTLATKDTLEWDEDSGVASVPVWALLAAYGRPVSLYPAVE